MAAFRVIFAACLLAASADAQQQAVFRAESALMEVEVRVTRRSEPVRGLTREDFTLFENGERQQLRTFDTVGPRGEAFLAGADSTSVSDSVSTPDAVADPRAVPLAQLRKSLFLYIAVRARLPDRAPIAKAIREFLDERLKPGVFVSLEGRPFTSSREQLERDLSRMLTVSWSAVGGMTDRLAVSPDELDDPLEATLAELNQEFGEQAESIVDLSALYGAQTLYRYIDLVRALGVYPGKKIVVLFSGGMSVNEDNLDLLNRFATEATRARVSFYPVDTRRLQASSPGGDAEATPDALSFQGDPLNNGFQTIRNNFQDSQDGLVSLAKASGGRALLNSNRLGRVFEDAFEDAGDYYTLGYYPTATSRDGRFRKIRIEVDRPGVKLAYRKGYYEEQRFSGMSVSEKRLELFRALELDTPFAELPLTAGFEFFRSPEGGPAVVYAVGIHPRELPAVDVKKGTRLAFTVAARAVRAGDERGVAQDDRRLEMTFDPSELARLAADPETRLHYSSQMLLPPGDYHWKAIIRDEASGKLGSYKALVRAPDFSGPYASSSLLLTSRIRELPPPRKEKKSRKGRKPPPGTLDVAGTRFLPSSTARYRRSTRLYLLFDLYNVPAAVAEPPPPRLALYRSDRRIETLPIVGHQTVFDPDRRTIRYLVALDTTDLEPGEYVVAALLPKHDRPAAPVLHRKFTLVE